MDTLYWKWNNAITPERCKEIIKSAKGTFKDASIGDDEVSGRLDYERRKISFVLWLNDNFEGGEFEFHNSHIKDNVIIPSIGTIVCFPSWVMHRVKPVTKGTRYSAVSWLVGKPVK